MVDELDPTAREANIKDSLKKYFFDNIETGKGIPMSFDATLKAPEKQGHSVSRWVVLNIGKILKSSMATVIVELTLCTRQDPEGYRLAQLRDTVVGYLVDADQTDGMRRIPFYRSRETGAWTELGAILVQDIDESEETDATDNTKFKRLTVTLRMASK